MTIMLMQPFLEPLAAALGEYEILKAWTHPDTASLSQVRAVVVAGEAALDTSTLDRLPRLGLIACFTAGYDGIDLAWAKAQGVPVTYAPGVNDEDVADHAVGLILAARRSILGGDQAIRRGEWQVGRRTITRSLGGQRLGIVGLGRIGAAVARRGEAMRLSVAWWGPRDKPGLAWPQADSLRELARASDILVVACPADGTNDRMIDATVIEALGPGGLLVNVARGQLVDEPALIDALRAGRLGAAALDVFATEPTDPAQWAGVPNLVMTPHTAGATDAAVGGMLALLKQNLHAFFAGEPLVTPLDP